jgi:SAM-dependent methyltransferase
VYSIGVLHHLPDPYEGFRSLLRLVRPLGTIAVWVYGYENNGFVRNVVEPVRRVSTKVPPPLLRGLAWPIGAAFHGLAKGVYRPLKGTAIGGALPLNEYMASVADFSFRQNYSIVFDQLVAPTAAYIKEPELRSWFDENGLEDVVISHRHGNSWRGQGRVPA